jgi:hypothetical protein
LTGGPIRLVIIAALAVVGIVVLTQAFPTVTQSAVSTAPGGAGGGVTQPTPKPSKQHKTPQPNPTSTPRDPSEVRVAVYNGTTTSNLAQTAIDQLTKGRYVLPVDPTNAPQQNVQTTAVYYRDAQGKIDAQALADKYFKGADVQRLPATATQVPRTVDIAVYLGSDYAASQP